MSDPDNDVVMAGTGDWCTIDSQGVVTHAYNAEPPVDLRDFIARAISDDSVARWNDTKAAGRVLTMPEMQAVRKALYQLASATEYQMRPEQLLGEGAIGLAPLPASVVAWVLEGEQ